MVSTADTNGRLGAQLEAAAMRAVMNEYITLNFERFDQQLRLPPLAFIDSRVRLGHWVPNPRGIELARSLLTEHGWGVLVEVLKHEMAHQYVDEVLGVREEGPHGRTYRHVCRERGIDARAAGLPEASVESTSKQASKQGRVLDRIAKLLALAQSANEHEAQSAANTAQRLMLKYNLDWVNEPQARAYAFRHVGRETGRVSEHERVIAGILDQYFFVDAIWVPVWRAREGKPGSVLELCGSTTNLEIASYVYDFLLQTAERLWKEHKRELRITANRDRRAFLAGVMLGFEEQLVAEQRSAKQEGLVWIGDPELRRWFKERHPRVRTIRRESSGSWGAREQGREVGRDIVLRRGVTEGSSNGRGGPKLLRS